MTCAPGSSHRHLVSELGGLVFAARAGRPRAARVRMLLEVAKAPVALQGVRPGQCRGDGRLTGRAACPGTGDRVFCRLPGPNGKLLAAV